MEKRMILLVPIGPVQADLLSGLTQPLAATFGLPSRVVTPIPVPAAAYDRRRGQYLGQGILAALARLPLPDAERVLGVIDADCYAPGLNFIFGQADIHARDCFIALPRLRQSFYSLPEDEPLFRQRVLKEAVHELGHTYGLSHCPDPRCVMHFSNSLRDTDVKGAEFCPRCQIQMNPHCRIGASGWVYPHWRGVFYPADLPRSCWYIYYAKRFETVEINYSFYRLPSEEAFDRWREQAPEGFVYAVKANRYITHVKRLKEAAEPLQRFLARARRLGDKLGPILWQLPPNWRANPERLEAFAALLPPDLTHAFEFRDPRWFVEPVRRILEQHGLAFCIFHMPALPCPTWVTSDVVYLRFHGSEMVYGGQYGRKGLRPWAVRISEWLHEGYQIYAYFNNDAFGFALEDARELRELIMTGGNKREHQP